MVRFSNFKTQIETMVRLAIIHGQKIVETIYGQIFQLKQRLNLWIDWR